MRSALVILVVGLVGVSAGFLDGLRAEEPSPDDAPYKHMLTGDDARRVAELEQKLSALAFAGKYAEAQQPAEEIVAIRRRAQGAKHWQTLDFERVVQTLKRLAALSAEEQAEYASAIKALAEALQLDAKGRYAQAQPLHERALVVRRRLLGEDHPDTAQSYDGLAGNLAQQRKYAEAQRLDDKALAIYRKVLGEDHPNTAASYNHVGFNLNAQAKYAEAQPLFEKALAIRRRVLGEDNTDTAESYNNVASNLGAQGRYAEAQPLFEKALAICRRALGEDHPNTAICYNNVASNLSAQGRYAEARPLFERALAICRQALGEDDPATARGYNNLAGILDDQGRHAEAQPLYEKALAISRKVLTEDHPSTATCYNNVAFNLAAQGKYAEAQPLYEHALAIFRRTRGEDHPDTATGYNNVAFNLAAQGRYAEAQALYEKALAIWRKMPREHHPDTARACHNLAFILKAQRKYAEAQPLYEKALAIWRQALGEDHPDTASCYNNLATNLDEQGRYADAQPLYEKALATYRRVLGEDHPDTARCYTNLALNLNARGKYAEAEKAAAQATRSFEAARVLVSFAGLDRAAFGGERSPLSLRAALLARSGKPVEAWEALEGGLARALLDLLSARDTWPLTPDERRQQEELLGRIHQLDQQIAALLGTKEPSDAARSQAAKLQEERAQARAQFGALATALAKKYHPVEGQAYDWRRIQNLLPDDAALVAWIDLYQLPNAADPAGDQWACVLRSRGEPAWVKLSGSGPQGAWTEADVQLREQVRPLLAGRPEDAAAPWQKTVGQLYGQRLALLAEPLGPTKDLPAVRHLIILPSDVVAGIPVEALVAARTDKQPAYTVSYAPSGTLFAWLQEQRRKAPAREARLLAVADPAFAAPDKPKDLPAPPDHGVLITLVQPDSNAARAGLQRGDVLLNYAGAKLTGREDLAEAMRKNNTDAQPGTTLPVTAWRAGQTVEVKVAPGPLGVLVSQQPAAEAIRAIRESDALLARARGDTFQPLPGSRREVEAIAKLFDKPEQLLGSDASEQRLDRLAAEGKLKDYRYLHLATHGFANPQQPLLSYLALCQDRLPDPLEQVLAGKPAYTGRLTAEHILRDWKLDADLVTLSACQTGLGKYERGEGYLGFAQGLLLAGARGLVLSEWSVDDDATALLMTRFYQNLLGKRPGLDKPMPKAEALREAKDWLRNLSADEVKEQVAALPEERGQPVKKAAPPVAPKPYAHPYYWAGFILIGDPN
jgi:tetratricopeptide (TPR) repeat protein